ncbi:hypothetical protein C1I63_09535 [Rathayibacter caricis DSM 15933]|uniref:DUF3558 domain-containing protein n=1 Tax=Rathayibacter caricis DSM 15933 TaxID=1328867 RepID=A0A2T4UU71_9MICO|nr:hypothetical protein [Rathayibacter caricis]PTL73066.1 hypothetical protein C1I63_09535 [Rathayibacter caricis DSM 15933]
MIRSPRLALPAAALVLALAGCSGGAVDIPESSQPTIATQEPGASVAPQQTAEPVVPSPTIETLDCEAVLPVETIESVLELPSGFATPGEQPAGCAWTMAGNPSALLLQTATEATLAEVSTRQAATPGALASDLGEAAFFRPADAALDPASTLTVLSGDRLLSLRSSVGDQAALETLAEDVIAALDAEE